MEMFSASEFRVSNQSIEGLYDSFIGYSRPLLSRVIDAKNFDWRVDLTRITRRQGISQELEIWLRRPVRYKSVKDVFDYLVNLNRLTGLSFKSRFGLRETPMLVWSRECPWTSFVVPDFNPEENFQVLLEKIVGLAKGVEGKRFFPIGLCMLIVLAHPFVDCNGRTMRLMLYKIFAETIRLPPQSACSYAAFDTCTKEAFVNAFFEMRTSNNFIPFIQLFA